MSEIDPYVKPVEFHVFDEFSFQNKENILPSALGCVVIEEEYPGSFENRPFWANIFQEMICILIQIIISVFVIYKFLEYRSKPILS